MQTCNGCKEEFDTWVELAQHIVSQRSSHTRSSVVWALTFLAKKDNVREFKPATPLSESTRKILKECKRDLSGETKEVRTVCPNCRKVSEQRIEVEYLQDRGWRNSNGTLIVNCEMCRKIT